MPIVISFLDVAHDRFFHAFRAQRTQRTQRTGSPAARAQTAAYTTIETRRAAFIACAAPVLSAGAAPKQRAEAAAAAAGGHCAWMRASARTAPRAAYGLALHAAGRIIVVGDCEAERATLVRLSGARARQERRHPALIPGHLHAAQLDGQLLVALHRALCRWKSGRQHGSSGAFARARCV